MNVSVERARLPCVVWRQRFVDAEPERYLGQKKACLGLDTEAQTPKLETSDKRKRAKPAKPREKPATHIYHRGTRCQVKKRLRIKNE